jgi:hypothetical protein
MKAIYLYSGVISRRHFLFFPWKDVKTPSYPVYQKCEGSFSDSCSVTNGNYLYA